MPSNQTPNYALNQWEAADRVQMEDFNADNARIDAAIKAVDQRVDGLAAGKADVSALSAVDQRVDGLASSKANVSALTALEQRVNTLTSGKADVSALAQKVSIITGAYTGNDASSRVISLGATPKALLLTTSNGYTRGLNTAFGGLALPGHPVQEASITVCEIVNNGFKVYKKDYVSANGSSYTYHYLALI